ncbi:TRAP transporter substrate-binding protein DctP [Acetobacteraceae bacterium H6797]|nr:TRAP transporter substrate-binding protein DctP [Acetobacteraceae bacterium H6797]
MLAACCLLPAIASAQVPAHEGKAPPISLRVVGGAANFSHYNALEVPFWRDALPQRTEGRLRAELTPYDHGGVRPEDLMRLVQLGVISVATVPLALIASEEPAFLAPDLPLMRNDIANLRAAVDRWRPQMAKQLNEQYGLELLGIHSYPAQLLFCQAPLSSLSDLAGRKVRGAGPDQSDLLRALKADPVIMPFADIRAGLRLGQVSCAITGGLPGLETGLHHETRYLYALPISWNLNAVVVSRDTLTALTPPLAAELLEATRSLEAMMWQATEKATEAAPLCATGKESCPPGLPRGAMTLVEATADEQAYRERLVRENVLPDWARRCGDGCREPWNAYLGPPNGPAFPRD